MLISSGYVVYLNPSVSIYPRAYPYTWNVIGTPRRPTIVRNHHITRFSSLDIHPPLPPTCITALNKSSTYSDPNTEGSKQIVNFNCGGKYSAFPSIRPLFRIY